MKSVAEYLEHVNKKKKEEIADGNKADFLFRGQNCDKPLLPHLARLKANGDDVQIEKFVIDEFKRTSVPYLRVVPRNEWE